MTVIPNSLYELIADLQMAVADIDRRVRNKRRIGKVTDVDHEKGKYRVQLNEGGDYAPLKTGWIPLRETSMGAIRTHYPVSVGQQVAVESENGDGTDFEIVSSLPSNENQRPSQSGDECVMIDFGNTRVIATAEGVLVKTDKVDLGDDGGPKVARIGDFVNVGTGSSAGLWPIVTGSEKVSAA